jgi:hypothetical protein
MSTLQPFVQKPKSGDLVPTVTPFETETGYTFADLSASATTATPVHSSSAAGAEPEVGSKRKRRCAHELHRPFACQICTRVYTCTSSLNKHVRLKHSAPSAEHSIQSAQALVPVPNLALAWSAAALQPDVCDVAPQLESVQYAAFAQQAFAAMMATPQFHLAMQAAGVVSAGAAKHHPPPPDASHAHALAPRLQHAQTMHSYDNRSHGMAAKLGACASPVHGGNGIVTPEPEAPSEPPRPRGDSMPDDSPAGVGMDEFQNANGDYQRSGDENQSFGYQTAEEQLREAARPQAGAGTGAMSPTLAAVLGAIQHAYADDMYTDNGFCLSDELFAGELSLHAPGAY